MPVMDGGIMRGIFSVGTIFAAGLQGRRFTLSADTRLQEFEDLLAPGGELIISGQLLTEKDYILRWFEEAGFKVKVERESGEWWSVLACS